ncbi:MAG TPA: methyltransferase domain-containing protein [Candidatus Acidoferrales bacterium]|nr:methyltransferase domain-containing protein [Candidatus Acidoferrales bacterium]
MSLKVFASQVLKGFHTVAAVAPSSVHLAAAMVKPLHLSEASVAVELGAGTGVMTRALLKELPRAATLFVFEINPEFITYLRAHFDDPRLVLINENVENIEAELRKRGVDHVDVVLSSLGLAFMTEAQRRKIFEGLRPFLRPNTVLTQFQYVSSVQFENGRLRKLTLRPLLHRYFESVSSKIVWRNVPPAYVYTCHPH